MTLEAGVDELDISKFANVPTGLNNLRTRVDDIDVDMLNTVPVDLKKTKRCSE